MGALAVCVHFVVLCKDDVSKSCYTSCVLPEASVVVVVKEFRQHITPRLLSRLLLC